jgi:DNA-binding transcriptional ArsR family regulator
LTLGTVNGAISGRSETAGFGAGADRPATVIRFTADDLARVRFAAAPAPLVETALGFAELRHHARRPVPDSWASRARHAFPAAARPLRDLIPASGPWPEFLDPPVAELDEGLEIVSATSRSRLRDQLAVTWRGPGRPSAWLRALADGDREALTTTVRALQAFYLACVAPAWPEITASFRADVADRAGVLARGGLGDLFGSLHPDLALRDGALERAGRALTRAGRPGERQMEGQGLQVLPSMLWTGPPLFSINPPGPLPSIMIYPGRHDARTGHGTRPADLDAVLGRTRARVLRALRDTCSTTELAARVSISVSSASEHATALRAADLIRTERHGPRVRHSLTVLGRALLSGSPSRGAVPLKQRLRVRGALG